MEVGNVTIIEYTTNFGWGDVDMVAIFNKNVIPEKDVKQLIRKAEEDNKVIQISKMQYENVFGK